MVRLRSNYFKIFLKINKVKYGKNITLIGLPVIYKFKSSEITIGNNCTIRSSFLSNLIGLYQRTIIVARESGEVIIGNNVGMSGTTIYARKSILIGDYCTIGANVKILDNDFHPVDPQARLNEDGSMIKSRDIIIGKNVFIGCNTIILKGTRIGDNCVIGAGSVVSGSFGNNVIIAGNPASEIKKIEVINR